MLQRADTPAARTAAIATAVAAAAFFNRRSGRE